MKSSLCTGLISVILPVFVMFSAISCSRIANNEETIAFSIESTALLIGHELKDKFEWSDTAELFYLYIMDGKVTLESAKIAESYLREVTHPVIANRLVRLAGMVGFDLNDAGELIGV